MRVLIKTLLWGLAVLAVLGVAAPYGVGWLLAARFDRVAAHLSIPGYLQIVDKHFDRGWFVSHARIVVRPRGPLCHNRPCPTVRLKSRVDHGPLAWAANPTSLAPVLAVVTTRVDPSELWPRYVFTPTPGPVTVTTRIGLDSRGRVRLALRGATFDVARRHRVAHVETAAVSGRLQSGFMARRIDGLRLDWPSFSLVRQSGGHLAWRNVHFQGRSTAAGVLADRELKADSMTLDNGHGRATRLTDLDLTTHRPRPDTTAVSLHIDKLVLPDNTRGTFILEARQQGMKALAWARLPGRWRQLGGWSGGALNKPALYQDVAADLLPPGTRIQVNRLELATRDGAIRARGRLAVPEAFKRPDDAVALLSQLRGRFRLTLPRSILRRLIGHSLGSTGSGSADAAIDERLHDLVARDLITPIQDGKRYRVRLALDHGQVRINGRRRPEWRSLVAQFQAAVPGL